MLRKLDFNFKIGFILSGFILLLVIFSQFYTPYEPYTMNTSERFLPPALNHLFGTDNFGRDNFSRIMVGTQFTLLVSLSTVSIGVAFGIILGLTAGYVGGYGDEIIMRFIDAMTSFPGILLALVMVTVLDEGDYRIVVALGILFIPSYTRIVRSGALQYKNSDFVLSARVLGASPLRIMFVHLLPNIYPQLLSAIIIGLSNAILAESSLSYLGLGIAPPKPSWGRMLSEAQSYLFNAPWYALTPGIMIIITVLGFNFIGEGIRKKYL
jgi:peptide/nickel transport system permease protein